MNIFTGLVGQWLLRRAMELGGIFAALVSLYMSLPATQQDAISGLFRGNWQEINLGTAVGIGVAVWGYVWSLRSTIKPQVVIDNKQVPITALPANKQTVVEESARTAVAKRLTLWERLTGK